MAGAQGNQSWQVLEPEHEVERTLFTSKGWVSSNTVLKLPSFFLEVTIVCRAHK